MTYDRMHFVTLMLASKFMDARRAYPIFYADYCRSNFPMMDFLREFALETWRIGVIEDCIEAQEEAFICANTVTHVRNCVATNKRGFRDFHITRMQEESAIKSAEARILLLTLIG